jgi:hypothetical protein
MQIQERIKNGVSSSAEKNKKEEKAYALASASK